MTAGKDTMHDTTCITHDLELVGRADRPRPCFRRGEHYAACPDTERCRGCVPRSATYGFLCPVCWAKITDALSRVEHLIVHLRSIEKDAQAVGERVDTSATKRLIVPQSWLTADMLLEALGSPPIPSTASIDDAFAHAAAAVAGWADVEAIVASREGAKRAVVLVKRMQTALQRWPDSEVEWREVPMILCPRCHERTLYRKAPLEYGDDITIECHNSPLMYEIGFGYDYCEFRQDWFEWLEVFGPVIEAVYKDMDRATRAEKRKEREG